MSLPRYPEYKESGIEWLGQVPAQWEIAALKRLLDIQNGSDHKAIEQSEGIPVIGSGGQFTYASEFLYDGESVLLGRKGTIDKPLYVHGKFWTVDTMYWSKILPGINGKFAYYTALTIPFDYYSTNTALPSMTKGALSSHLIAYPPFPEQTAIATFLDHETGKIDALITEQEKLLTLLAEKRQATISHAVTKGLNPNVPMKDSGVEWLGEVPEHWEIKRVKRLITSIEQGWSPQCESFPVDGPSEWGVLKVGCVNGGKFNSSENKKLPSNLIAIPELSISKGDLLISRANTRELVGSAAVALDDFKNLLLCDKLYRLRLQTTLCLSGFLALYLSTEPVRGQIELEATGASSSMLNIGQSVILDLPVSLPCIKEQFLIMDFLEVEFSKLDTLTAEATHSIALMKERRSALISAAVTGKIDVRSVTILAEAAALA